MDTLTNLLKIALYRIIFNLPLGIFGIEILNFIFFSSSHGFIVKITSEGIQVLDKFPFCNCPEGVFLYIVVAIIIGEILPY